MPVARPARLAMGLPAPFGRRAESEDEDDGDTEVPAGGQAPRVPAGGQAPRVPAGGQASSVPVAVPEYPDEVTKPIGSFMEIIQDVSGLYHDETRKSALKDLYTWEEASVDDSMDSSNSQATLKLL